MNDTVFIKPWSPQYLSSAEYDVLIYAIGYELRSRYIAETIKPIGETKVALAFMSQQVDEFKSNLNFYKDRNFKVHYVNDEIIEALFLGMLNGEDVQRDKPLKIGIDVSSMSRSWPAALIIAAQESNHKNIQIDFFYADAIFAPAPTMASPIVRIGPINPRLAGWSDEPERPCVAVFGLGYELDKAVGTLEYLEPASIWTFQTSGRHQAFHSEVQSANRALWDSLPNDRRISYDILKPYDCFQILESLCYGIMQDARLVLVPLGPKIFSICCLAVACVHYPYVAVWRVSSGQYEPIISRKPSGEIVGLSFIFSKNLDS